MNQQEAKKVRKAYHEACITKDTDRKLDRKKVIDAAAEGEPGINDAMIGPILEIKNFGEVSARELAITMYLYLEEHGYDWDQWKKE
jgi:hypothetical protein